MGSATTDIHAGTDTQAIHGWLDLDYGVPSRTTRRARFAGVGGLRSMGGRTAEIRRTGRTGLQSESMSNTADGRGTIGWA